MVRLDIIAGIKNAVERGASIEQARQILLNSGYSESDVSQAINYLTGGVVQLPSQASVVPLLPKPQQDQTVTQQTQSTQQTTLSSQQPQQNIQQPPQTTIQPLPKTPLPVTENQQYYQNVQTTTKEFKVKKPFPLLTFSLVSLLVLLVVLLILIIIFKNDVTTFLQNLFVTK